MAVELLVLVKHDCENCTTLAPALDAAATAGAAAKVNASNALELQWIRRTSSRHTDIPPKPHGQSAGLTGRTRRSPRARAGGRTLVTDT